MSSPLISSNKVHGSGSPILKSPGKQRRSQSLPWDLEAGRPPTLTAKKEKSSGSKLSCSKLLKGLLLVGIGGLGGLASGRWPSISPMLQDLNVSNPDLYNAQSDRVPYNGVVDAEDEYRVYSKSEPPISDSEDWYTDLHPAEYEYIPIRKSDKATRNAIPAPDPITVVLGASHQDEYATFMANTAKTNYINSLINCVTKNPFSSLWDCQAQLMREGIPYENGEKRQYPVSSINLTDKRLAGLWDKNNHALAPKQRFALLLTGVAMNYNDAISFSSNQKRLKKMLMERFQLPNNHIIVRTEASNSTLDDGMRAIKNKISESNINPANAEVMIIYTGHGGAEHPAGGNQTLEGLPEGAAKGILELESGPYSETEFWKTHEKHLPGTQTVVLLDTCQAGAWIDPPPAKLPA